MHDWSMCCNWQREETFTHFQLKRFQLQTTVYDLNSLHQEVLPYMIEARSEYRIIAVGEHMYIFGGGQTCVDGTNCRCER